MFRKTPEYLLDDVIIYQGALDLVSKGGHYPLAEQLVAKQNKETVLDLVAQGKKEQAFSYIEDNFHLFKDADIQREMIEMKDTLCLELTKEWVEEMTKRGKRGQALQHLQGTLPQIKDGAMRSKVSAMLVELSKPPLSRMQRFANFMGNIYQKICQFFSRCFACFKSNKNDSLKKGSSPSEFLRLDDEKASAKNDTTSQYFTQLPDLVASKPTPTLDLKHTVPTVQEQPKTPLSPGSDDDDDDDFLEQLGNIKFVINDPSATQNPQQSDTITAPSNR